MTIASAPISGGPVSGRPWARARSLLRSRPPPGLIDLTNAICPGTGACPVVINNMIVWRDQHHLTATFAASLAPEIDKQLVAILNAWDLEAAGVSPAPSASSGP